VSGYLKWIGFDKGDVVKQGELLAVIDAPEIEDQYKQAEADYAIKKVTYERYLSVWKDNPDIIAKQDVDVAKAAAESAKHQRDSRRNLMDYTKVYAPFPGVITARFADPGALIQSATGSATQAAPLFTIMDLSKLRVYVSVPQESSLLAKPGVLAVLTARETPGREWKASITRTTGSLDPATRTLLVEIDIQNERHELQPGVFATATLFLEQHPNSLALPPTAIVSGKTRDEKWVFVVEEGKARKVPIRTGIDDGVWVELLEGLTGEEQVGLVGKSGLTDDQAVMASSYDLPAGQPSRQKM
jgi:RND family efflux transporter MFP subunit